MDEAINEALLIIISSSVSLEAMFVGRLFANGKLTVAYRQICRAINLSDKVDQLCCVSDIGLTVQGRLPYWPSWLKALAVNVSGQLVTHRYSSLQIGFNRSLLKAPKRGELSRNGPRSMQNRLIIIIIIVVVVVVVVIIIIRAIPDGENK